MLQAQSMAAVSLSQALSLSPATIPLRAFPSETEHSEKDKDTDVDSALTVSFVQALHEDRYNHCRHFRAIMITVEPLYKDTLNRGHLSNADTVCCPNHIELCTNPTLN